MRSLEMVISQDTREPLLRGLDHLERFKLVFSEEASDFSLWASEVSLPFGGILGNSNLNSLSHLELIGGLVTFLGVKHPLGTDSLPALRHLVLRNCGQISHVLRDLTELGRCNRLHLQHFELIVGRDHAVEHPSERLEATKVFLESFTGLITLLLLLDRYTNLDHIAGHGPTLRNIVLFETDPDRDVDIDEERAMYGGLLKHCPHLEQLGLPLLVTNVDTDSDWVPEYVIRVRVLFS